MNKKILTLLAAGFMGGLSANAAISDGKYHQLKFADNNGQDYVLSVGKSKVTGGDSLVMVKDIDPLDFMKESYKKTLWKISEGKADNTTATVYTFTNYATGSVLSLDLSKSGAALVAGQSQWLEDNGKITAIKGGDTYGIGVKDVTDHNADPSAEPNYRVFVTKTSSEIATFTIATPSLRTALTAEQINGLYGTASAFEFTKKNLEGNPIDGVGFRAQNVTGTNYVNLLLNTGKYLVVDTTTWQNAVNNVEYWKLTTDAKPAQVAAADKPSYIASTLLKNGRSAEMYAFQVAMDIAAGYVMTITPQRVPDYANIGTNGEERGKQTRPSFNAVPTSRPLVYGQFADGALVLAATSNPIGNDRLSTATVKFGKVDTPSALSSEYVYYVQDYDKRILAPTVDDPEATAKNPTYKYYATTECNAGLVSAKANIPSYMWYVAEDGSLTNMMTDNAYGNMSAPSIVLVNEAEGLYKFDGKTLKLTKGPKIADAQKMAYRTVSDEDLINGALSFRLVSKLANDLYVVGGKGGVLAVANSELADAQKLKVELVMDDYDGDSELDAYDLVGNDVRKPIYQITNRKGDQTLTYDAAADQFKFVSTAATLDPSDPNYVDPLQVSFKATGVEDQYKIVIDDDYAITANAATGILYLNDVCDPTKNTIFEFAKKDAPTYGAPAYGHVQITTLEDDNKMIAPQLDGFAALKAEGQLLKSDVYTNDTLKLWLDTAFVVEDVIPFYYLSSSAFNEEGEMRNFLVNPFTLQAAIDAYNADPETEDEIDVDFNFAGVENAYRAAFIPAAVCGKDSLSIAGKDTVDVQALNPAAVAFKVVVDEGDEVYNIVSELRAKNPAYDPEDADSEELPYTNEITDGLGNVVFDIDTWYLAQLNNVLFWTQDENKAESFVINRTKAPTANEAIEAESGVEVIAGQGVVTVQGAAGKVITVANILGQTIANQVAASDNVTIAAPAGVVVVTVDGEAVKKVVK